jgi:hypothetical protein
MHSTQQCLMNHCTTPRTCLRCRQCCCCLVARMFATRDRVGLEQLASIYRVDYLVIPKKAELVPPAKGSFIVMQSSVSNDSERTNIHFRYLSCLVAS